MHAKCSLCLVPWFTGWPAYVEKLAHVWLHMARDGDWTPGPFRCPYRPWPNKSRVHQPAVTRVPFTSSPSSSLSPSCLFVSLALPLPFLPRRRIDLAGGMAGARRGRVSRSLSPSGLRAPTLMSSFEVSSPAPTEEQTDPFECCSATPLPQVRLLQEPVLGHYRRSVDSP